MRAIQLQVTCNNQQHHSQLCALSSLMMNGQLPGIRIQLIAIFAWLVFGTLVVGRSAVGNQLYHMVFVVSI